MQGELRVGPSGPEGRQRWSLVKVFDGVALILVAAVVCEAIGGILSGLGVASLHLNIGAPSGSGLSFNGGSLAPPTAERVQLATVWAGVATGLLLLASLALLSVPRLVWDLEPQDAGLAAAPWLVAATGVVAAVAAVAGVVWIVDIVWRASQIGADFSVAVDVAVGVAAVAVTALTALLAWFSRPFLWPAQSSSPLE